MNAVNLMPKGGGRRRAPTSLDVGPPLLGLLGGLVLVLVATSMFVVAHNRVGSRRAALQRDQAAATRWSAAAGSFSTDVATLHSRGAQIDTVRGLAGSRYNWSLLLGQLAGVMPKGAAVSTLTADDNPGTSPSAASSTAGATSGSGISLSGCALSQNTVAATMVALRRIQGVSLVSLSQSSRGGSASAGSSGGCAKELAVSFEVTLDFSPPTEGGTIQTTAQTPPASTTTATGAAQ